MITHTELSLRVFTDPEVFPGFAEKWLSQKQFWKGISLLKILYKVNRPFYWSYDKFSQNKNRTFKNGGLPVLEFQST